MGTNTDRSTARDYHNNSFWASDSDLQELISLRAHELFLQRDITEGDALSDWLSAEREVLAALDATRTALTKPTKSRTAARSRQTSASLKTKAKASKSKKEHRTE
jgi:hypothetical protein